MNNDNLNYWMTERDNLLDILKGLAPDGEKEEALKYQNVQKALATAERRIEDYERHTKEMEISDAKLKKEQKEDNSKNKKSVGDVILDVGKILVPVAVAGIAAAATVRQERIHQEGCLRLTEFEMQNGVGMMSATKNEVRRNIPSPKTIMTKM